MKKKLASVYFAEVAAERELYGGYYKIPAVPKGEKPVVIEVTDKFQRWQKPYILSGNTGRREVQTDLIKGEDIANDIVRQWTENGVGMTPQCHPGIWIVRDVVPLINPDGTSQLDADNKALWRPATEEEKAQMWAEDLAAAKQADAAWAEYLIQQSDIKADDPKQVPFIPELAKKAARHYGRDRSWLHELKDNDVKVCPYCAKSIAAVAIKCPHCQEIVDFEKYAELEAKKKAAVDAASKGVVRPPLQQQSGKHAA